MMNIVHVNCRGLGFIWLVVVFTHDLDKDSRRLLGHEGMLSACPGTGSDNHAVHKRYINVKISAINQM